jgi:UDP-glucose 4-epimerase
MGESHEPETHLIPRILQNLNTVEVYGNDYDTPDGTCVRDYVHVCDVVDAHLEAVKYLDNSGESGIFNLGSGVGYSVLDIIKTVKKVTGKKVKYNIVPRREGDPSHLVADITKAKTILNFNPKHDISSIVKSAYEWEETRSTT